MTLREVTQERDVIPMAYCVALCEPVVSQNEAPEEAFWMGSLRLSSLKHRSTRTLKSGRRTLQKPCTFGTVAMVSLIGSFSLNLNLSTFGGSCREQEVLVPAFSDRNTAHLCLLIQCANVRFAYLDKSLCPSLSMTLPPAEALHLALVTKTNAEWSPLIHNVIAQTSCDVWRYGHE